jgi:hypothetical protein
MTFEMEDRVRVKGTQEVWTVKGYHQGVDKYQIQLGLNAATLQFVATNELELVEQPKKDDDGPRFVPTRSIMD